MLDPLQEVRYRMSEADMSVYQRVLPRESKLLDILEAVPWERFKLKIEQYYSPNKGQPSYPVLIMLKLELLRYLYRLGDREVIERASTDLLFRYFLQIPITARLPHPTSLTYFRGRVGVEGFQEIFDELIAYARELGLVRDRLRIKDATHVIANVAVPSALGLLASLREKMLRAVEAIDPIAAEGFRVDLEHRREETETADDATKLQVRLELVASMLAWIDVVVADRASSCEADSAAWQRLLAVQSLARKITGDFLDPAKGDRTLSVVDPDVRCGMHGQFYDGYLLDVMIDADSQLITAADVLPANGDEARNALALIEHEEQVHGNDVEQLSIDGIGFNGVVLRDLESAEGGPALDVIVPPKNFTASEGFAATQFEFSEEGSRLRCPAGQLSGQGVRKQGKNNTTFFQFSRAKCVGCLLRSACCPQMTESSRAGRRVSKNEYEQEYQRARAKSRTPRYAEVRREHPAVERKLNEIVRHQGGRRARYWGRSKVKIQQLTTCLTVNLKRLAKLLGEPMRAAAASSP